MFLLNLHFIYDFLLIIFYFYVIKDCYFISFFYSLLNSYFPLEYPKNLPYALLLKLLQTNLLFNSISKYLSSLFISVSI